MYFNILFLQKLFSLLNEMIDAFEQKFGPVEDRSIFDGEIVVPPHLRNVSLTSMRANRFANGSLFGSVPRSRTLFSLPPNARHTFHGSVPDLSRHSSPFSFNNNTTNNTLNNIANNGSGGEVTKITLNTSTKLALTTNNNYLKNAPANGKNHAHAIESIDEHRGLNNDRNDDDDDDYDYKSNSIRSLNDVQLRERSGIGMEQDRALYCQSLGRPIRTQKESNQQRLRSQPQSLDAYNSEGYMALIKTNLAPTAHGRYIQRASLNRPVSPTMNAMNNDGQTINANTSTFQRKAAAAAAAAAAIPTQPPPPPPPSKTLQTSHKSHHSNQPRSTGGFANDFSLNNSTKFKLPRVTLNHSAVTNPQQ